MSAEPSVLQLPESRAAALLRPGMLALLLFSIGHFAIDMYSGAIGAFQPLLVDKLGMTLTQAGLLGGMMVFSGSFVQPAYGLLSDRFHSRMFSVLGPATAGIFISLLGLAWNFPSAAILVFLGGAGIASFHPQASAWATLGLTSNRGRWMAVFISAGTLGLAIGPTFYASIFQWAGPERSYFAAIPGVIVTLVLFLFLRQPAHLAGAPRGKIDFSGLRAVRKPLIILHLLVVLRSAIQIVFGQLLPLYLHRERGFSLLEAASALTMFQVAGAAGGFVGGHFADKFGGRRVILISMIGCLPFLSLFFFGHGLASMAGLALSGLILLFTIPVNVVMAQDLAPQHAGTVSSLMQGFAWGIAGMIFIPLIGFLSDRFSMQTTMSALTIFPLIGFFLTLALPKTSSTSR
ncbi:MAG TPA: MFS transporter [Bryobacteraceae bacterium]|jgi:FSR family fosmidomycin resistance protein-like MFS transporter|nr:MFS transporter [Bryobacteraceae bacterium]